MLSTSATAAPVTKPTRAIRLRSLFIKLSPRLRRMPLSTAGPWCASAGGRNIPARSTSWRETGKGFLPEWEGLSLPPEFNVPDYLEVWTPSGAELVALDVDKLTVGRVESNDVT